MKFISKAIATIIFGIIAFLASSPIAAALVNAEMNNYVFLAVFAVVALACFTAPTGRRAWGRGSLIAGALFLALPLTIGALSGIAAEEIISQAAADEQGATAVGATIGAGLMVGAASFVGFILGAIFIIFGLIMTLGGRREVIIINN